MIRNWRELPLRLAKTYLEAQADRVIPGYSYIYNRNLKYWANKFYPKKTKKRRMPTGLKRKYSTMSRGRRTMKNKRRSRKQKNGKYSRTVKSTMTSKGPFLGLYQSQGATTWRRHKKPYAGKRKTAVREALKISRTQRPQKFLRSWFANDTTPATDPMITLVDKQNIVFIDPLFAFNGKATDFDDMRNILIATQRTTGSATEPQNTRFQNRVVVSGKQEVEVANTGTNLCYLTVYKYVFKKDYYETNPNEMLTQTEAFWNQSGNGVATKTTLGFTPFDAHECVNNITILEKSSVQIQVGEVVNFGMSKKNQLIDGNDLDGVTDYSMVGLKGVTCGYILQWTGEATAANIATVSKLAVSSIKEYNVTIMPTTLNMQTAQNMQ